VITFGLCLLYVALIYIRPGEIMPALVSLRLPMVVLIVASVSAAFSLFMKPRRFIHLPGDVCFLGFILATMVSNPVNGNFTVGPGGLEQLVPLIGFYLLIRIGLQTERQLRWLVALLVLLTMFQATSGIVQSVTGAGIGGSTAVLTPTGAPPDTFEEDAGRAVARIRGTGIFGDPNDLAMSLILVYPFLFTALLDPQGRWGKRLLALAALATLSYAVYLTQSRGGFIGLAALGAAFVYRRFGRRTALVAAAILVALVLAAPGRVSEISSSEESAQGRIQAWSAGFEMLKSKPVLGVGTGEFTAHHQRVAHNSFVHVFAETGLIGLFFFVGMFYWFFVTHGPLRNVAGAVDSALARDLWAGGIGVVVCACFLSRQYVPVLYLPLVLGASRVTIARAANKATGDQADATAVGASSAASIGRWWDWLLQGAVTIGVVVATYVAIRTLAV
jgi:putative inorganic carbon (hco3(-)) transporter